MAGPRPPYGFRYNDTRDNYVVDSEKMRVIERIFRMVGTEGYTMNATRRAFNREGVQPPSGEFCSPKYVREAIKEDVYRCPKRGRHAVHKVCINGKNHRAAEAEAAVWDLISRLLKHPERWRAGLDEMVEQERAGMRGDPDQEAASWLEKLSEVEQERLAALCREDSLTWRNAEIL